MTTDQLVAASILRATGEISTAAFGDDDYSKVVQLANLKIDAWAKETNWNSLYDPGVNCGTISANDTFDLDDTIRMVSTEPGDFVQIITTDGRTINYQTVPANELKRYSSGNYCARVGATLRFNKVFSASDAEFGGTLKVPAYLYAEHLAKANDEVPVDDPNWLVAMTAADLVQNDNTLAQNRDDFIAEANDLMTAMKRTNSAQVSTVNTPAIVSVRSW